MSMVVSPCAVTDVFADVIQPCAMRNLSASYRRRMRDRRVAVRRAQKHSLAILDVLARLPDEVKKKSCLRMDAEVFTPASISFSADVAVETQQNVPTAALSYHANVDWDSLCFQLDEDDVQMSHSICLTRPIIACNEDKKVGSDCPISRRRNLRIPQNAETLPEVPTHAVADTIASGFDGNSMYVNHDCHVESTTIEIMSDTSQAAFSSTCMGRGRGSIILSKTRPVLGKGAGCNQKTFALAECSGSLLDALPSPFPDEATSLVVDKELGCCQAQWSTGAEDRQIEAARINVGTPCNEELFKLDWEQVQTLSNAARVKWLRKHCKEDVDGT